VWALCSAFAHSVAASEEFIPALAEPDVITPLKCSLGSPVIQSNQNLLFTAVHVLGAVVGDDVSQVRVCGISLFLFDLGQCLHNAACSPLNPCIISLLCVAVALHTYHNTPLRIHTCWGYTAPHTVDHHDDVKHRVTCRGRHGSRDCVQAGDGRRQC